MVAFRKTVVVADGLGKASPSWQRGLELARATKGAEVTLLDAVSVGPRDLMHMPLGNVSDGLSAAMVGRHYLVLATAMPGLASTRCWRGGGRAAGLRSTHCYACSRVPASS